jgi:hypothetical protein
VVYTEVKKVIERLSDIIVDATGYISIKLAYLVILLANAIRGYS